MKKKNIILVYKNNYIQIKIDYKNIMKEHYGNKMKNKKQQMIKNKIILY